MLHLCGRTETQGLNHDQVTKMQLDAHKVLVDRWGHTTFNEDWWRYRREVEHAIEYYPEDRSIYPWL